MREKTPPDAKIQSLIKRFAEYLKGNQIQPDSHCLEESIIIDHETQDIKEEKVFSKENCDLISH